MTTSNTSYNVQLDVSNFPSSRSSADRKTFRMLLVSELADILARDVVYDGNGDLKNKGVQLDKEVSNGVFRYSMKFSTESDWNITVSDIMETLSGYSGKWQVLSDVANKMVGGIYIPEDKKNQMRPFSQDRNENGFWRPKISIQKVWA